MTRGWSSPDHAREDPSEAGNDLAKVRPIPYPFHAMLAICSDLDETPTKENYWQVARFLNTTHAVGKMGPGVGLETGNSMYFDMAPDQFAYWNTDERGREMIRGLMRSGHIDCLHSFGDLASSREHAARALEELERHGCRLKVWIDHATAPTNFGSDIMRGHGDDPAHPAYHADLTCAYGVEYAWMGRVTSVIGQNASRSLRGVFEPGHPLRSARTLLKERAKGWLASLGHAKYSIHRPNELLRTAELRDGHGVLEFLRSNPHWSAVDKGETADGLAEVLTRRVLDTLVSRKAVSVLYTHLGKSKDRRTPLNDATREALRRLAGYEKDGRILVTTTRRALDYCQTVRQSTVTSTLAGDVLTIDLAVPGGVSDVGEGLSIRVARGLRVRLLVNGREASRPHTTTVDSAGESVVSFPWRRLEFPSPRAEAW